MARVNTSLTVACTPRRAKRSMRDAVPDACSRWVRSNGCGHLRLSCSERDRTAARTCATPRLHAAASLALRMEEATERGRCPARLRPAGRARFLIRRTQYKCGQSGVRNNHPLGKTGYDWRLLLASGSSLSWEQEAAGTGLSNGVQMLVHSATDGSSETAAMRAMARRPEHAFRIVGLKA